jgi:hypothetical protein
MVRMDFTGLSGMMESDAWIYMLLWRRVYAAISNVFNGVFMAVYGSGVGC